MAFAGDLVVAHELLRYGELGSVFVFRRADLATTSPSPVATFAPAEGAGLWARPVGFAALDGALVIEWFRVEGATRTYALERHSIDAGGVSESLGRFPVRVSDEIGLLLSPVTLGAAGRYAALSPYPRRGPSSRR